MIYLDHAAATPMSDAVFLAMKPYFSERFFNASAAYLPAVMVRREYEAAKDKIAAVIGAKGVDLVMTAGATEAINLAFKCVDDGGVVVSAVEHQSVMANAKAGGRYDVARVDEYGILDLEDMKSKITGETRLVSVCLASSELGSIQPVAEVGRLVRAERQARRLRGDVAPIYLHCDASQGLGLMEIKVNRLGVDMLTLNAAKVYGPKGVGVLWVGRQVRLAPVVVGGGQERGLRSGTENVAGVVGFAAAAMEAERHLKTERGRIMKVRGILQNILAQDKGIKFLGNQKMQLVNFLPIAVDGLDAERLIFKLEAQGVYVATGAACAASKGKKSEALRAIGLSDGEIEGSLRISLGKLNDEQNAREAGELILRAVAEERARK